MQKAWFVLERIHGGEYHPVIYYGDKPTGQRTDAPNRLFKDEPKLIPDKFMINGKPIRLDQIADHFYPPEHKAKPMQSSGHAKATVQLPMFRL